MPLIERITETPCGSFDRISVAPQKNCSMRIGVQGVKAELESRYIRRMKGVIRKLNKFSLFRKFKEKISNLLTFVKFCEFSKILIKISIINKNYLISVIENKEIEISLKIMN